MGINPGATPQKMTDRAFNLHDTVRFEDEPATVIGAPCMKTLRDERWVYDIQIGKRVIHGVDQAQLELIARGKTEGAAA